MIGSSFRRFLADPVKKAIPGVGRVILATSCKGGVGKSTVAMNTAIALSKSGKSVGLFDADIYGPSVPLMANTLKDRLQKVGEKDFLPVAAHGIETVSAGNAVDRGAALIWKGPAVAGLLNQLLRDAKWSILDYLIIDTPPGTGDVLLSLAENLPIDGALLVSSSQKVVAADVVKSIDFLKKIEVPIFGIIHNFDGFICPCCGEKAKIFPGNGIEELSEKFNIPVIGSIPIDTTIPNAADKGVPAIIQNPESKYSQVFMEIAKKIIREMPPKNQLN